MQPPSYQLLVFDTSHSAPAADLSSLHEDLLPHSPVALMGRRFMGRFYYRLLPREGLICGAIAYVEGKPAGFIVATTDSSGFMTAAIRRHWGYLIWVMTTSMLLSPRRVGAVWEAWQIMRHLGPQHSCDRTGELLSFGVLRPYRERSFVLGTGIRISADLLGKATEQLREKGISTIRAIVDEDNLEARIFYHGLGWTPGKAGVPGWRKKTVEFLWRG